MKRFAILLASAALTVAAHATPQQDKMKSCNAEAKSSGKTGDERKAFMKECLSAKSAAAPSPAAACEQSAKDKKLHGAAAKSHIKKCTADAASAPQ
ncbi:PsiF family protein [Roseateles cellulosilyticus]|uniref:PsiF family protein n=1 Tax=Pelomonas cellulosilytica TaxID=2906762 RepID=A0ABS8XR61_9BURK|nr:PsiF family protein [Pelomonas sp. P8]MCE4553765.1 PsiF family protein [Pelomonas sp. P8]